MQGKRIGTGFGLMGAVWLAACGGTELPEETQASSREEALSPVTLPIRINAGGGAFTDTYGRLWEADRGYTGEAFTTTEPIGFTSNDGLYQSMRVGVSSYEIPVPGPGVYTVQLLFTEPERGLPSPRSMRILAEAETVVYKYQDLVTPLWPYTLYFDVPVRDNGLSLYFQQYGGTRPPIVSAVEVTSSQWSWVGGSPEVTAASLRGAPALAVDTNNRPVVAWESDRVLVSRWTGSAWQPLGGLGDPQATQLKPTLLMDASGAPLVAFIQRLPNPTGVRVRAQRWSGTTWTDVGGLVGLQDYEATAVASTLDNQGRPLLAVALFSYVVTGMDARLVVYRVNGVAWEPVGDAVRAMGTAARDGELHDLSIAVDRNDRIVVAWGEDYRDDRSFTHVFRRDNGVWQRVGTQVPDNAATTSRAPSLELAADGTPWVAYLKNGAVDVVRLQGNTWAATPAAGLKGWPATVLLGGPVLRMDGTGAPTVLLTERADSYSSGRFLRKWNGTAWVPLNNRVGPFDTTFLYPDIWTDGLAADMTFAVNRTGQLVVALPEDPPSGATHGRLRVRTFSP